MTSQKFERISASVQHRLSFVFSETYALIEDAHGECTTQIGTVSFHYKSSKPNLNLLDEKQQAQALFFVYRYQHLPSFHDIDLLIEQTAGEYFISNLGDYRRLINEYRSVVQNQKDSIHYTNIESLCQRQMISQNPSVGLSLSVVDDHGNDVTGTFRHILKDRRKAIELLVKHSDLDYLYNGVLQHSDGKFMEQLWSDHVSGNLNYIILRNALILDAIKDLLLPHYRILNTLTFPRAGSL